MLKGALERAVHRPRTPLYGAFTQTVITQLGPLVEGGSADPDEVARRLDEVARRLDEALRKALRG